MHFVITPENKPNFNSALGQSLMQKAQVYDHAYKMRHQQTDGTYIDQIDYSHKAHFISLRDLIEISGLSDLETRTSSHLRSKAIEMMCNFCKHSKESISKIFPEIRTISEYVDFIHHTPEYFIDAIVKGYKPMSAVFIPREGRGEPSIKSQGDTLIKKLQRAFSSKITGEKRIQAFDEIMVAVPKLNDGKNSVYPDGIYSTFITWPSDAAMELNKKFGALYLSQEAVYNTNDKQYYIEINTSLKEETRWNRREGPPIDPNAMSNLVLPGIEGTKRIEK